ncbi:MAG TPA: hypothetical protein VFV72_12105 [Candidatus Limnocylindrales bacterium]|nr:hypothetical protein [Candidatus Limnocylindrales bacterium]
MTILLAALTATVIAGAVVTVSAREARAGLLGLLVVLIASPLVADPLPGPLPLAARIAAAFLAARLIAIAIRDLGQPTAGSRLGWPVEALAAAAGAAVGFGTHGLGAPALGPAAASAAGFAVGVLAAAPIVTSRDVFRLGTGAMLLLSGGLLVRAGLGGTPSDLEQLVTAGLVVGVAGAAALIIRGAREATGTLVAVDEPGGPRPPSRHLGRGSGAGSRGGAGGAHPVGGEATPGASSGASSGR